MKRIYQKKIVQQYIEKYSIQDYFDNCYNFYLIQYEKGETMIHPMNHTNELQLVINGSFLIYYINQEGRQFFISESDDFTILGDMEFVKNKKPLFFVEANSNVEVLALSIEENKEKLNKDIKFLHSLLESLVFKLYENTAKDFIQETVEEKLLHYIEYSCEDEELTQVGKAANNIHCSRRQVQRVLKNMCEKGIIYKTGKGKYRKR